jgi:hypothetical protein
MENVIDFFQRNKGQLVDFMNKININHSKTIVKLGFIENKTVCIAFAIYHELYKTIVGFDEKLKCLFNAEIDIKEIESQLLIDKPCKINFTPFLRISDSPAIHAFQMTIKYEA